MFAGVMSNLWQNLSPKTFWIIKQIITDWWRCCKTHWEMIICTETFLAHSYFSELWREADYLWCCGVMSSFVKSSPHASGRWNLAQTVVETLWSSPWDAKPVRKKLMDRFLFELDISSVISEAPDLPELNYSELLSVFGDVCCILALLPGSKLDFLLPRLCRLATFHASAAGGVTSLLRQRK